MLVSESSAADPAGRLATPGSHWGVASSWPERGRRVAYVAVFNTLIALMLSLVAHLRLLDTLVYSQCIGLSILTAMELAGNWYEPRRQPAVGTRLLVVLLCVLLGYAVGTSLGSAFTGFSYWQQWGLAPLQSLGHLTVTLVAGAVITAYFVFREQIARTQSEAEAARRLAVETQLRLLQAQLEPHMLFNTLANLRALIAVDPPRAQAMLDHMIAFMRAALNASRSAEHTLADEFARLADYLALMQIRMGARLRTELRLPAELRDMRVPPMLLQPLVENSIKHGLEPRVEGGELIVEARLDGGRLCLSVSDSGVGWSAVPLSAQSFGLQQVRERLRVTFGAQAHLATRDQPQGGAYVELSWPQDASPTRQTEDDR